MEVIGDRYETGDAAAQSRAAEKSQRDANERRETWRRMRLEAEARLAGHTGRLAQLTAGQADALQKP